MGDSSASYIRMVQHLIEKCIIFQMSKEECVEALSKYADIKPVITSTVWKELEKENKEFFETYSRSRQDRMSEAETTQVIQSLILDSSTHHQFIRKESEGDGPVDPEADDTTTRRKSGDGDGGDDDDEEGESSCTH